MAVEIIEERKSPELAPADVDFFRAQAPLWDFLVDRWFRAEIDGFDRLPDAPVLLVGVHAGGILPIDAYVFAWQWWRHFGEDRLAAGTAHDFLMVAPGIGDYLRKLGTIPASREGIFNALEQGRDVILYPGGDADAMRAWTKRDTVQFAGRHGFVKQAIRAQVPIVPVANSGASDTYFMLTDGRRLAKLFQLDKILRSEVFPIGLGFPLGLTFGSIPQIPLPAKLRTEILEPVDMGTDASLEEDDEFVELKYQEVVQKLQAGMDRLARRRRFPIFG